MQIGSKIGDWEIVDAAEPYVSPKGCRFSRWRCKCVCGNEKNVRESSLKEGESRGCGCKRDAAAGSRLRTHGLSQHPLYHVWNGMLKRCNNKGRKDYKHYGGRGITVCERWSGDNGCLNFIEDMYASFSEGLELERIDVNGNYEPSNCTWASRREQVINRRPIGLSFDTRYITYNNETLCISQWADKTGIPYRILIDRLGKLKWSLDKAFNTPCKVKKVSIELGSDVYSVRELFKNPPNVFTRAKKQNLSFHQFIANVLAGIGTVRIELSGETFEVEPTSDMKEWIGKLRWKTDITRYGVNL